MASGSFLTPQQKQDDRRARQKELRRPFYYLEKRWYCFKPFFQFGDPIVQANKRAQEILQEFEDQFQIQFPGYIPEYYDRIKMLASDKMVYTSPLESEIYQFTPPADKISFNAHAYQVCLTPSGEKALIVLFISDSDEFYLSDYPITSEDISYDIRDRKTYMVIHFVSNGVNYRLDHF